MEVIGNWADGPELEGESGAVEVFCFDVVCPILNRVSVGRLYPLVVRRWSHTPERMGEGSEVWYR